MPSAPGTEQMRRAFRNVLHLFTRQQCPPSSFWKAETRGSHSHTAPKITQRDELEQYLTNSCLEQLVCINKDIALCFSLASLHKAVRKPLLLRQRTGMIHEISAFHSQNDLWVRRIKFNVRFHLLTFTRKKKFPIFLCALNVSINIVQKLDLTLIFLEDIYKILFNL